MSNRFTERAQRVILIAQEEAHRLNHDYVGTEHVLLGLVALGEGVAVQVLSNLGVDLKRIPVEVEKITGTGNNVMLLGEIPFTPRAKKVLEFAVKEAINLGQQYVGTEHLLLGLIVEEEGIAAQVLDNLGVRLDIVREDIQALVSGEVKPQPEVVKKAGPLVIDQEPWYTMAEGEEVYQTLNSLAMTFEPFHYENEELFQHSVRQYEYDENTFFKAEQVWAEREGLA